MKFAITAVLVIVCYCTSFSQTCTTLGQLPSSAFPVCGTNTFHQTNVPICSTHNIKVPGCPAGNTVSYEDKNPFWYKFTCYVSGSLGFLITPKDLGDDYDWQLYDITNRDPNDVFTDQSLVVTGNWSGSYGTTGASASGVNFLQCASDPADNLNTFSAMPNIIAGHTYLLLVSHFSNSQSGYDLSFGGGTAIIKDPKIPALLSVETSCGGDIIRLKLNKHIRCSTIANDGSDFYVLPGNPSIASVTGIGCSSTFDTDSIEIHLNTYLDAGNYRLYVQTGSDGNTLLDDCDNEIPVNSNIGYTILPKFPTPLDSLAPLKCAPEELHLIMDNAILCNTIAADGSDFSITGTYPVTITGAKGNCSGSNTSSREIIIQLSKPLQNQGNFTLTLTIGSDGNGIIDECGIPSTPGSRISFSVKDTVNADFTYQKFYGCNTDTINFQHAGGNGINFWKWNLDEQNFSSQQNPQGLYHTFNRKNIQLIVSNGFCSDTSAQTVDLDNYIKADFTVFDDICPNEKVQFTNTSQGKIVKYDWSFGDGIHDSNLSPDHIYQGPSVTKSLTVNLTVSDSLNCTSTAGKNILLYSSCYLAVPTAFTPNDDGKNDFLHPLNAVKADQLEFKVYNRWGQLVFETHDWKKGWNGTINNIPQPSGIYVWFLHYFDRDTHESRFMKGTAALIR